MPNPSWCAPFTTLKSSAICGLGPEDSRAVNVLGDPTPNPFPSTERRDRLNQRSNVGPQVRPGVKGIWGFQSFIPIGRGSKRTHYIIGDQEGIAERQSVDPVMCACGTDREGILAVIGG